jgi:signal transduction histidine kinase
LSAYLFVGFNFVLIYTMPIVTKDLSWLLFAIMGLLLSAMLLRERPTTFMFAAGIVIQLVHAFLFPLTATFSNFSAIIVFMVTGPLVLVFMSHRVKLERERQEELRTANMRLRESETLLEKRVAERTRDLEVAADVSRQVATELDLHQLLPQLVERTRSGFNLYHVSVFLLNADSRMLNYEAGTGEAGGRMKTTGKLFDYSAERGLVARAARTRQPVLVNDVQADESHLVNPYLPDTHAELVVPMIVGERLVGVLDMQSEQINRFTSDDLRVMTALAEQLAVAVQNARLYANQVKVAEELRALDDLKSQFLASMSHELRTPLNAILNFSKFISMGVYGPVTDKQKETLDKIVGSGQHLLSLINDVLDITKIESDMMQLFIENDVDLREELQSIVATAETLLAGKSIELIHDIDDDLPRMVGDKRRIRQILLNLVSNACKFTEQGSVTISAKNRGEEILFAIIDTGPGIAPEDIELIFEPFQQTEHGIKHTGGTGLGLPISKKLTEAHGGRLWVETEVGEGSTFYVVLPTRSPQLLEQLAVGEEA